MSVSRWRDTGIPACDLSLSTKKVTERDGGLPEIAQQCLFHGDGGVTQAFLPVIPD